MPLKGITKGVSVIMEEKRFYNQILGLELGKREGTNKRDSEVATIETEGNSRENSAPETKRRKDFQGGREIERSLISKTADGTNKRKMEN